MARPALARTLLGVASLALLAGSAAAAPIPRQVDARLTLDIGGLASIVVSGAGTLSVDSATRTLRIPAGLVSQTAPIIVPVTSTTAINSLSASWISNQSGTLALSGGVPASELCPAGPLTPGKACVRGGGLAGEMGLTGSIYPYVIPVIVKIPILLNSAAIGQAASLTTPVSADGAPWTLGVGRARTASGTLRLTGTTTTSGLKLVSPTYFAMLGTEVPIAASFELRFSDGQGLPAFIPEPTTLLLVGLGITGLVATARAGRRR